MPALSPTMTQGNMVKWHKAVGDKLAPGESIAEVETDKASMDFEFQEDGFLAKILVGDGTQDIPVGTPIAVYVEEESDVPAFADFTAADAGEPAAAAAPTPAKEEPKKEEPRKDEPKSEPAVKSTSSTSAPTDRIIASPLAKTIALEKGVSLKGVKGSGPNGRIIAKDVENIKPTATATSSTATQSPAAPSAASTSPSASYTDIPLTNMRKVISKRLTASKQGAPDYIVSSNISVSKLLKLRASLNASANDRYKLSVNDLLIKAIALASKRVPEVNSYYLENENCIRQFDNVDVSVAVATPTGLITPIVKNANFKGLQAISKEIKDLGKRAKENKLKPEEFQGGTITISNLGMNPAVSLFTSILNPPQSAIIAIGTVEQKAIPDKSNANGFSFDQTINITGTFDHRVVDGALGGEFIKALKQIIENPLEMLL
ncbi:hypothetical protein B5S33_g4228 [[Candida] boidinii]|nr:hypothetical protein B5S33_g4228 [[Candida] boidinii]